jgi:hypothetical protein
MATPQPTADPTRDDGLQAETTPEPTPEAANDSAFDHDRSMETVFGEQHLLHEKPLMTQLVAHAAYAMRDRDGVAYQHTKAGVQKTAAVVAKYTGRTALPTPESQKTPVPTRQAVAAKYGPPQVPAREQTRGREVQRER